MLLFERCAARDDARAEYILALCHKNGGVGVEPDAEKSFFYLKKAADHGDSDALFKLAVCMFEGDGINRDIDEAFRLFRSSAEQGDAEAAYRLYLGYSAGEGLPLDEKEATRWLEIAAEYGQADSQFLLGLRYRHGQGALRRPEVVQIREKRFFPTIYVF